MNVHNVIMLSIHKLKEIQIEIGVNRKPWTTVLFDYNFKIKMFFFLNNASWYVASFLIQLLLDALLLY